MVQIGFDLFTYLETKYPSGAPILYQIFAALMMAFVALVFKLLSKLQTLQVLQYRFLFTLLIQYPIITHLKIDPYVNNNRKGQLLLLGRGAVGFISVFFFVEALKLLDTSLVLLIFNMSPIWTIGYSILITKQQKASFRLFFSLSIGLIGLVFVTKPPFIDELLNKQNLANQSSENNKISLTGIIYALLSSIAFSSIELIINSLGKLQVSSLLPTQYFAIVSLIAIPLAMIIVEDIKAIQPPNLNDLFLLIMTAVCNSIFQTLRNRAYLSGDLTIVSMLSLLQVCFGLLVDLIVFGIPLQAVKMIGFICIIGSLVDIFKFKNQKKN